MPPQSRSRSGDLSFFRPYFSFHGGLSLQALEISRDSYSSESATAFLVRHDTVVPIEAPIDLDSLPLLGVAHVINSAKTHWDGDTLVIEERQEVGPRGSTWVSRYTLSQDGKTLAVTHNVNRSSLNAAFDESLTYEKQQ